MDDRNYTILYIIGLAITTVLMFFILFSVNILSISFLLFFWIVKFLSGFGLILSIANGFLILLDKTKEKMAKNKKFVNFIIIFQIVIPTILIIYATYAIFSSYYEWGGTQEGFGLVFDLILYIYGIASLLITLYIIPIIKEEFQDAADQGFFKRFKKGAKQVGRGIGIKKKYYGFRKEYAKKQIQDQKTLKDLLEVWRHKFAIYLLVPLAIGTLIFTPITFICLLFWIKIFIIDKDPEIYEKYALLISIICCGLIAILSPILRFNLYITIENLLWTINIFYLIGIVIASIIFVNKLMKLQGIMIKDIRDKIKQRLSKDENEKE
jgi:MFS family permease